MTLLRRASAQIREVRSLGLRPRDADLANLSLRTTSEQGVWGWCKYGGGKDVFWRLKMGVRGDGCEKKGNQELIMSI